MSIEIVVPEMGESVIEATVGRWLVGAGASVKAGQPLVELETDKVDLEVSAERDGVLAEILVEAGADVKIGDVLGKIEVGAEAEATAQDKPEQEKVAEKKAERPEDPPADSPPIEEEKDAKATPVARRMAEDAGMDVAKIPGSGSGGRVTKEDVEKALNAKRAPLPVSAPAPSPVISSSPSP
ncbi:MAG TPA: E3 binding domain-containing protein, partial [Caldilineaceae bacterium]|nr:E3 binding domain-containing protein [Caldilineaceae bacterium]